MKLTKRPPQLDQPLSASAEYKNTTTPRLATAEHCSAADGRCVKHRFHIPSPGGVAAHHGERLLGGEPMEGEQVAAQVRHPAQAGAAQPAQRGAAVRAPVLAQRPRVGVDAAAVGARQSAAAAAAAATSTAAAGCQQNRTHRATVSGRTDGRVLGQPGPAGLEVQLSLLPSSKVETRTIAWTAENGIESNGEFH